MLYYIIYKRELFLNLSLRIREFQGLRGLPEVYLRDAVLSSQDPDATDGGTEMQAASALEMGKVAREEQCAVPQERFHLFSSLFFSLKH